ncbi:hypothetical protein CEK28_16945 [Xenophilus sp. AP218F]|nr:hypothetical protein CEK28_16945 [Xenophilus sp. AP218F]
MKLASIAILLLTALAAQPALANPATDTLSNCLADNTTGRDRKELARWVLISLTKHPQMSDIGGVAPQVRQENLRYVGALMTRLFSDNCTEAVRNANRQGGSDSIRVAFDSLGKLAMQELTANPQVNAALMGFVQYVDEPKVERALRPK